MNSVTEVRDRRPRHWFWLDDEVDRIAGSLGVNALVTYIMLCRHAGRDQKSWPAQIILAKKCGISEISVRRSIRILQKYNLITVEKNKESGRFFTNIYSLSAINLWNLPEVTQTAGESSYPQGLPEVTQTAGTGGHWSPSPEVTGVLHRRSHRPPNYITTTELDKNITNHRRAPEIQVKTPTTAYQQVIKHILESYQQKFGAKYPMNGKCGKAVNRIIGYYGPENVIALWDEFLARDWNWYDKANKKVVVPRSVEVFESKLPVLLEEGAYKSKIQIPRAGAEESGGQKEMSTIGEALAAMSSRIP